MKDIKKLRCTASLDDGVLTLQSGQCVDFNEILKTIENIALTPSSAQQPNKAAKSLDWCIAEAQLALKHLREAFGQHPPSPSTMPLDSVRDVYIESYGTSDYSSCDAPEYAHLKVDQNFIDTLRRLANLCKIENLSELRIASSLEKWGPGDASDSLRLTAPEMVVTPTLFWFTTHPKHADYDIVTRAQQIDSFVSSVVDLPIANRLVLGDCEDLEVLVDEYESEDWSYQFTEEDIENVLRNNMAVDANTEAKSFKVMAGELFDKLDSGSIIRAAMFGDTLDEQTGYAYQEIACQLRQLGILRPLKTSKPATPSLVDPNLNNEMDEQIIGNRANEYDGIEIHGVRNIYDPADERGTCIEVDEVNPEFFSVYCHLKTGGVECVGDHATMELAQAYADKLETKYGFHAKAQCAMN